MPAGRDDAKTARVLEIYAETGGNVSETARRVGLSRQTVLHHIRKTGITKPMSGGQVHESAMERRDLPGSGVRRYILTSAQNNTRVNARCLSALRALADYYEAEILCSSFTYNQNAYGELAVKRGTAGPAQRRLWYDPEIEPLLDASDRDIELAPGLVWCGRMNTLPTAVNPLSGFETYTGRRSGIFPHTRQAMQSVASVKTDPAKFNYTTGTVTQRNYIQKRAGLRAEFHHIYGGLLVEVDSQGRWFVRQLNMDRQGRIYDLDVMAQDGEVWDVSDESCEAINWGDVHLCDVDPTVRQIAWGRGGMLDVLRPRHQFMHDLVDLPRNHWDMRDPHKMFEQFCEGREGMEQACREIAEFLSGEAHREWCRTVVVNSNHDNMLDRWLREADYRRDPVNAIFFLRAQLAKYQAIERGDDGFLSVETAMRQLGVPNHVRFLREDESYIICPDSRGGIECGQHGHLGPGGSRGSVSNYARMGRRANRGHDHGAAIFEGIFTAGTCSRRELGWNAGPDNWSHSHIVTYRNGKRAIITMWEGGWRAED